MMLQASTPSISLRNGSTASTPASSSGILPLPSTSLLWADNSGFTVGEEIKFGDKANGGFSKVSMGMAITKSCQHPVEAAA